MKKIIIQLEKQEENLREFIQNREDKVSDASERWQESEACEEFEDKTQEIEIRADELACTIEELKELI